MNRLIYFLVVISSISASVLSDSLYKQLMKRSLNVARYGKTDYPDYFVLPSVAVDAKYSTCFIPTRSMTPFWMVDLGLTRKISVIMLHDGKRFFKDHVAIQFFNEPHISSYCKIDDRFVSDYIICKNDPTEARFVGVQGPHEKMKLCEVHVMVCFSWASGPLCRRDRRACNKAQYWTDKDDKVKRLLRNSENVALGKDCGQDYSITPAAFAVDGDPRTCSQTDNVHIEAWFLDLGAIYVIGAIVINNGEKVFGSTYDIQIAHKRIFKLCSFGSDAKINGTNHIIECIDGAPLANEVKITRRVPGVKLCEVQVRVCHDGYWGNGCWRYCTCLEDIPCDKQTGKCDKYKQIKMRTIDVALGKPTNQTSPRRASSRAVDGDSNTCSLTEFGSVLEDYWMVDLESVYPVSVIIFHIGESSIAFYVQSRVNFVFSIFFTLNTINLYLTKGHGFASNKHEIYYASDDSIFHLFDKDNSFYGFFPSDVFILRSYPGPFKARYIKFIKQFDILRLCDVQVRVCKERQKGLFCEEKCERYHVEDCDLEPGLCDPYKQITGGGANVAFERRSFSAQPQFRADYAVDGIRESCYKVHDERPPVFEVDVGRVYRIAAVVIYNEKVPIDSGYEIEFALNHPNFTLCNFGKTYDEEIDKDRILCRNEVHMARYVKISNRFPQSTLTLLLCEVEVRVCFKGYYGVMCRGKCECSALEDCDKRNGICVLSKKLLDRSVDMAFGRPTNQTRTLHPSSLAVDGKTTTCSNTGLEVSNGKKHREVIWTVDLGKIYFIACIIINDELEYFTPSYDIRIAKDDGIYEWCNSQAITGNRNRNHIITCRARRSRGMYVKITNKMPGMRLCEVQVRACYEAYYGKGCEYKKKGY